MPYIPNGPYMFQGGKNQGKSVEIMMFTNYGLLRYMFSKMKESNPVVKNKLHLHLEWVLTQGENRTAKNICRVCRERPVKCFSILGTAKYGYSIGSHFACCEESDCRSALVSEAAGTAPLFLPIRFSSIMKFGIKSDQRQFVKALRSVFQLPERLTKEMVFQFFSE